MTTNIVDGFTYSRAKIINEVVMIISAMIELIAALMLEKKVIVNKLRIKFDAAPTQRKIAACFCLPVGIRHWPLKQLLILITKIIGANNGKRMRTFS